jgi:hypothetical protein
MALRPLAIIVSLNVNRAKKPRDLQGAAFDEALWCFRLERSVELIHNRLNDRLEQLAGGLENQRPELRLESQQALIATRLIQELLDISGGFLLECLPDFVPFFFESGEASVRVIATVVSTNCRANFSNSLRPSIALARAGAFSAETRRVTLAPSSQI